MKKTFLMFLVAAASIALFQSGCNTIHGAGRDIEKAGDAIKDSAK